MRLSNNGHIVYEVNDDDIKLGILTFPETVTSISFNIRFNISKTIEKLVLPKVEIISSKTFLGMKIKKIEALKLVKICNNAFENCSDLEYVRSPILNSIGDNAFKGCFALKYIDLICIKEIGSNAFEYSDNLRILGNLTYTKIGFTSQQSNFLIVKLAKKLRQKKGILEQDNQNKLAVDYSRKIVVPNPNYEESSIVEINK